MLYRYVLFYKPYNVLTQFGDRSIPETIDPESAKPQPLSLKNFISIPEIYPVGRLDQDSEGLLLLTNDGELQHYLTDPKFQHPRTYWVQVEHQPKDIDLEPLRQGIAIRTQGKTYQTRPATVTLLSDEPTLPPRNPPIRFRKTVPTSWLEITLTEGRNRQVRRMTAAIGFPTLRLVRVAIAHLRLEGLEPGQWRDLTSEELKCLIEIRGKGKKMQHLLPHLPPRKRKTHG